VNTLHKLAGTCVTVCCLNACVTVHKFEDANAVNANYAGGGEQQENHSDDSSTNDWQAVYPDSNTPAATSSSEPQVAEKRLEIKKNDQIDSIRIGKVHLKKKGFQSVKSLSEKNIFMQEHDYSCGAASLATIMHYYFGDDVSEQSLLEYIQAFYTPEEYKRIEADGLSFLELEQIAQSMGYQTASVRLKMESLKKLKGPVIVFVAREDYRHFAVLKGVFEDRVFIADPSRGNVRISKEEFAREWDGRTFILGKKGVPSPKQHAMSVDEMPPLRKEIVMLRSLLKRQQPIIQDTKRFENLSQRSVNGG